MGNRALSEDLIRLGNRIQDRRLEMCLSQEEVAKKAGISTNTVSRIEGGQTAMSIGIFMKLLQILRADAGEFLGGNMLEAGEDRAYKEMMCRIQSLGEREQCVVMQTVDTLVEGLRRCRTQQDTADGIVSPCTIGADRIG